VAVARAAISATKRNADSEPRGTAYLGLLIGPYPSARRKKTWLLRDWGDRDKRLPGFGGCGRLLFVDRCKRAKNSVLVRMLGVQYNTCLNENPPLSRASAWVVLETRGEKTTQIVSANNVDQ
jgi:hypothetical protein